ncbi:MAG: CRISPR-associated protein Cas4 [Armatimonadota bacterium]|nr:CRISPR-associated protein Cas4 [Armatimonadota bacterium]
MKEWLDEELVAVSAVEHYSYCPRQCALIYVECVYEDNEFTLRGSFAHARADESDETVDGQVLIERALPIWSDEYGLVGRADVVEIHPDGTILPVEYKVTPKNKMRHAEFQLCAQAICLEEMFGRAVLRGATYSSSSHQRREVVFTQELRNKTLEIVELVRSLIINKDVPPPVDDARCHNCSLVHVCFPSEVNRLRGISVEDLIFKASDKEVVE